MTAAATRTTTVKVTHELAELGVHFAEDMHQFRCFLDKDTAVDFAPKPGQILDAQINEEGWVLRATLMNQA